MKKETRMYYDCPIEALYMAKNFGVVFIHHIKVLNNRYDMAELLELVEAKIAGIQNRFEIYIAPESEHIFEPKDYDIVSNPFFFKYEKHLRAIECDSIDYFIDNNYEVTTREAEEGNYNIVNRDSKHFFMPKTEEIKKS